MMHQSQVTMRRSIDPSRTFVDVGRIRGKVVTVIAREDDASEAGLQTLSRHPPRRWSWQWQTAYSYIVMSIRSSKAIGDQTRRPKAKTFWSDRSPTRASVGTKFCPNIFFIKWRKLVFGEKIFRWILHQKWTSVVVDISHRPYFFALIKL